MNKNNVILRFYTNAKNPVKLICRLSTMASIDNQFVKKKFVFVNRMFCFGQKVVNNGQNICAIKGLMKPAAEKRYTKMEKVVTCVGSVLRMRKQPKTIAMVHVLPLTDYYHWYVFSSQRRCWTKRQLSKPKMETICWRYMRLCRSPRTGLLCKLFPAQLCVLFAPHILVKLWIKLDIFNLSTCRKTKFTFDSVLTPGEAETKRNFLNFD